MPEITKSRKSHEIAISFIGRQDGSCRRLMKQRDDGDGIAKPIMDKFYLPGTFVDLQTGNILSGPGECQRWTQAYTFMELVSITTNAIAKGLDLRQVLAGPVTIPPENTP